MINLLLTLNILHPYIKKNFFFATHRQTTWPFLGGNQTWSLSTTLSPCNSRQYFLWAFQVSGPTSGVRFSIRVIHRSDVTLSGSGSQTQTVLGRLCRTRGVSSNQPLSRTWLRTAPVTWRGTTTTPLSMRTCYSNCCFPAKPMSAKSTANAFVFEHFICIFGQ